jgi:hypothetical protein
MARIYTYILYILVYTSIYAYIHVDRVPNNGAIPSKGIANNWAIPSKGIVNNWAIPSKADMQIRCENLKNLRNPQNTWQK